MSEITCPVCSAEFDLVVAFKSAENERALDRLVCELTPLGARLLQYVQLFKPAKAKLSLEKKMRLLTRLLPELQRQAVTWKGRNWPAPHASWAKAIDQMLASRDAQRLELPMKSHGYLYAIVADIADKHEAAAEQQREEERRSVGRAHASNAPTHVGALFTGGVTLITLAPQAATAPASAPGMSPTVRAMRAAIERKKGEQS